MPKSPQDIYARHLLSPRGYPLWTPEPSHQLLVYRRDGLRIGDVGVVIPEDGCFDVFFNLCLPADHPFHRATGVPNNFKPIALDDMDIRTVVNAENPGRILSNSSVKSVSTVERSAGSSSRTGPSGTEYGFTLSSSEGALLILPEGAERHDLRNHHRFLELATQHGADWYRFVEERVGQIIGNDSLYLITGLSKTTSWSLAAFEKTAGTAEYPAQFRVAPAGGNNIAATYTWDTTRALDWRAGPFYKYELANQAVFIRGFKVALRTKMFGKRRISVKADSPSTRPNPASSFGAVPGDSLLAYVFGGMSTRLSGGSGAQDEVTVDSELDDARNEIQDGGAFAVGEHVVIHRIPGASEAFHPSDIINQYLLNEEPSANVAITHDDIWITMLEENLLQPKDFAQQGRLEAIVSRKFDIISEGGAVYLESQSGSGTSETDWLDGFIAGSIDLGDLDVVDIHAEPTKLQHTDPADLISSKLTAANQMPLAGDPPIAGTPATMNSDDYRCLWLVDGVPCNKMFRGVHGFMAHLDHVHTGKESAASRLVCQWSTDKGPCGRTCGEDGFRRHIETHHLCRVFACTECGRSFSRLDSLLVHQRRSHGIHGGSKEFAGPEVELSQAEVGVSRQLTNESGTPILSWQNDSRAGGRLDYKGLGVNVVDAEPAVLPHTNTANWQPLDRPHLPLASETTGADPPTAGASATMKSDDYRCLWLVDDVPCNKIFRGVHGFMAHLDHVHAGPESAASKLVCQWLTIKGPCGRTCGRDDFKRHVEIHHLPTSRAFVCTECGRFFGSPDSLRRHQDAHGSSMEFTKPRAKLVQATKYERRGMKMPSDELVQATKYERQGMKIPDDELVKSGHKEESSHPVIQHLDQYLG